MLLFEELTISDSDLFLELQEASSEALRQIELKKRAGEAGSPDRHGTPAFSADLGFLTQLLDRRLRFSPERETHFNMRFTNVCGRYSPVVLDVIRTALLLGLSVGIAAKAPISGAVDTASLMMCLGSLQIDSIDEDVAPAVRALVCRAVSADSPGTIWNSRNSRNSEAETSKRTGAGAQGSSGTDHNRIAAGRVQSVLVTPYFLGHVGLAGIATAEPFLGSPAYILGPQAASLRAEANRAAAGQARAAKQKVEETEVLESSPVTSTVFSRTSEGRGASSEFLGSAEEGFASEKQVKTTSHPVSRGHRLKPVFMTGLVGVVDSERRSVLLNGAIGVSVEHSVMTKMFDVVILDGVAPSVMTLQAKRGPYFVKTATPQVLVSNAVQARFPFLSRKRRPSSLFQTIAGFRASSGNLTCDDANAVIQLNTNLYNNLWAAARKQLPLQDVLVGTGLAASGDELEALGLYLVGQRLPFSRGHCCH